MSRRIDYLATIRVDYSSEFISRDMVLWACQRGVTLVFSRSGNPRGDAFISGCLGPDCLSSHWFKGLEDPAEKLETGLLLQRGTAKQRHRAIGPGGTVEICTTPVRAPDRSKLREIPVLYSWSHQKLTASRLYLCSYGEHENRSYLHLMNKESGALTEIDQKVTSYSFENRHFFSNDDELVILSASLDEKKEFILRRIEGFGFGAVSESSVPFIEVNCISGYSRFENLLILQPYRVETVSNEDIVSRYHYLDDTRFKDAARIPHRKPPEIYDQSLPVSERTRKIEVNQFGEIAVLVRGWVIGNRDPVYSRVEVLGESGGKLHHKRTFFVANGTEYYSPCDLAVDFDGSFLVLTERFDYAEPDRFFVHRLKRTSSSAWSLETINSFSMENQQFSAADIFIAGGYVFVAGVTDRGAKKPMPGNPSVNYERYPFLHSFRQSDGQDTGLAWVNFHSNGNEEWSIARAFVDNSFIYLHGFIHGRPTFKRFQHDGAPAPF